MGWWKKIKKGFEITITNAEGAERAKIETNLFQRKTLQGDGKPKYGYTNKWEEEFDLTDLTFGRHSEVKLRLLEIRGRRGGAPESGGGEVSFPLSDLFAVNDADTVYDPNTPAEPQEKQIDYKTNRGFLRWRSRSNIM